MPDEKVDTAADLEAAKAQLATAEAAHAAALEESEANKSPEEIFIDLLEAIVMRLGNRPEMRAMVAALKPKAVKEEPPAKE
jgi:hypothetical protein